MRFRSLEFSFCVVLLAILAYFLPTFQLGGAYWLFYAALPFALSFCIYASVSDDYGSISPVQFLAASAKAVLIAVPLFAMALSAGEWRWARLVLVAVAFGQASYWIVKCSRVVFDRLRHRAPQEISSALIASAAALPLYFSQQQSLSALCASLWLLLVGMSLVLVRSRKRRGSSRKLGAREGGSAR